MMMNRLAFYASVCFCDVERVCHWSWYDRNALAAVGESTGLSESHSFDYSDEGVKSNGWLLSYE